MQLHLTEQALVREVRSQAPAGLETKRFTQPSLATKLLSRWHASAEVAERSTPELPAGIRIPCSQAGQIAEGPGLTNLSGATSELFDPHT